MTPEMIASIYTQVWNTARDEEIKREAADFHAKYTFVFNLSTGLTLDQFMRFAVMQNPFKDQIDWLRERVGDQCGSHRYLIGLDDPDVAMEFKIRWM